MVEPVSRDGRASDARAVPPPVPPSEIGPRYAAAIDDAPALDYFETVQLLKSWAGSNVLVYPVTDRAPDDPPLEEMGPFMIWGTFKPVADQTAELRRNLSDAYARVRPELALGDAPLELYERQVAHFTFERMGDGFAEHAGFAIWQHDFIDARWLDMGGRYRWLWIRMRPVSIVAAEEVKPLPPQS